MSVTSFKDDDNAKIPTVDTFTHSHNSKQLCYCQGTVLCLACVKELCIFVKTVEPLKETRCFKTGLRTWINGAAAKALFGKTRNSPKCWKLNPFVVLLRRCAHGTWGFCFIGAWQTSHCVVALDVVVNPVNWRSIIRRKYHQVMFVRSTGLAILPCCF